MPIERLPAERRAAAVELRRWYRDEFTAHPPSVAENGGTTAKNRAMIDRSVYPDVEHGEGFEDDYDRADYVQRICAACDFGVPPDRDTVALFREWRDVFDRFPLPDSPSYHALRAHFRWPAVPIEPSSYPAPWETLDALEGRDDPCRDFM